MPENNVAIVLNPAQALQKELEQLYERKCAIDELIASLERYDRFRNRRMDPEQRTA